MTATFVGGPLHGRPVPADAPSRVEAAYPAASPSDPSSRMMYVAARYYSEWPIPGWDLFVREDITRHPARGGVNVVWTARVWAQEWEHGDIVSFFQRHADEPFRGALIGYERRDRELLARYVPRAIEVARQIAERTGTLEAATQADLLASR